MIPKEAIDKAFEGGWPKIQKGVYKAYWQTIALDPSFWQSLGKALGWEKKMVVRRGMVIGNFGWENPDKNIRFYGEEMGAGMDYMNPWVYYAHRFYDLILTGADTESFWKELLPSANAESAKQPNI